MAKKLSKQFVSHTAKIYGGRMFGKLSAEREIPTDELAGIWMLNKTVNQMPTIYPPNSMPLMRVLFKVDCFVSSDGYCLSLPFYTEDSKKLEYIGFTGTSTGAAIIQFDCRGENGYNSSYDSKQIAYLRKDLSSTSVQVEGWYYKDGKGATRIPISPPKLVIYTILADIEEYGEELLTWLKANATKQSTPTPTLITFTIAGTSYQADDGMTWGDWCNSDYNTDNYGINTDGSISPQGDRYMGWVAYSNSRVNSANAIVPDRAYRIEPWSSGGSND